MKQEDQKNEITFCLRLPSETHEKLRLEAFNFRTSINQLINKALDDYLDKKIAVATR